MESHGQVLAVESRGEVDGQRVGNLVYLQRNDVGGQSLAIQRQQREVGVHGER